MPASARPAHEEDDKRPLIVHLTYAFNVGGLETLVVECINRMPAARYRHALVCLTDHSAFAQRISHPDVELIALHKPPGNSLRTHAQLWRVLRRLRPTILHTYNLAAFEYNLTAALAGVPIRVHAEHGRDASDPHGLNVKHNVMRRTLAPLVDCFIAVSDDLQRWLDEVVRIAPARTRMIKNGVDTARFSSDASNASDAASPWHADDIVIGTVARIQDVKNHRGLVEAFALLRASRPDLAPRLRLSIIGDGPLFAPLRAQVHAAGLDAVVWLPGARADIAALLHGFTIFALPSLAEGTPVSLLEAMACALPVVAARVGGIPEVIDDGVHGSLVDPRDGAALALALGRYAQDPVLARAHGEAARRRIEQQYSIDAMLHQYLDLYDGLCHSKLRQPRLSTQP
jgi:sugar transferase (PEP-CTERM/EpsH1 system associated)